MSSVNSASRNRVNVAKVQPFRDIVCLSVFVEHSVGVPDELSDEQFNGHYGRDDDGYRTVRPDCLTVHSCTR
jgi:hypothetical protein